MSTIILKNTTTQDLTFGGVIVRAMSSRGAPDRETLNKDPELLVHVAVGNIIISDGVVDLPPDEAESLILNFLNPRSVIYLTGSDAMVLHRGTTAERPVPGVNGMIRYNTNIAGVEAYENGRWGVPGKRNIWETFLSDNGTVTTASETETLTVTGTGGIKTSITGTTLTIDSSEINPAGTSGLSVWSEIIEFGEEDDEIKNRFLNSAYSNHPSIDSTALALADGEVVHVTISTEEKPTNNWFVQVIINAQAGVGGRYGGGVKIGTDLEKPTAVLDKVHTNLTGFLFSAGDRLQVYALQGTLGEQQAVEPVVRLYVRYN